MTIPRKSLFVFLAVAMLSGCNNEDTGLPEDAADKPRLEKIQIQLNWFPESQHGGYYEALLQGWYDDAGLDVELIAGGPNVPVIQSVGAQRVPFAIANADQVLLGRAQGAECVALLAAMQDSPRCIMVHADSGIERFDQLQDITLALGSGKPFADYLKSQVPLTNVTIVPYSGSIAAFLRDKNYAQQAYVTSEPYVAELQGAQVRSLMVSDLGYNPYTSVLITSEKMIREQPQVVRKVVEASRRGWQQYLREPEATNKHIHRLNPELELQALDYALQTMRPLCLPDGLPPEDLGRMAPARWTKLNEQLVELKLLATGAVDPLQAFHEFGDDQD